MRCRELCEVPGQEFRDAVDRVVRDLAEDVAQVPGTLYDGRIRCRYTGKERDTESGLDYFRARYYASSMGRFMSPDWSAKQEPVPYSKLDNTSSPRTSNGSGATGGRTAAKGRTWSGIPAAAGSGAASTGATAAASISASIAASAGPAVAPLMFLEHEKKTFFS